MRGRGYPGDFLRYKLEITLPGFNAWLEQVDLWRFANGAEAVVDYYGWCALHGFKTVGGTRFKSLIAGIGGLPNVRSRRRRAEDLQSVTPAEDAAVSAPDTQDGFCFEYQDTLAEWSASVDVSQFSTWEEANTAYRQHCQGLGETPQSARSVRKLWLRIGKK